MEFLIHWLLIVAVNLHQKTSRNSQTNGNFRWKPPRHITTKAMAKPKIQ